MKKITFKLLIAFCFIGFFKMNAQTEQINSDGPIDPLEILQPVIIQKYKAGSLGPLMNKSLSTNATNKKVVLKEGGLKRHIFILSRFKYLI